ncbi:MAG: ribonuclease T2 family protein [Steroidobacteraceae bacterium]
MSRNALTVRPAALTAGALALLLACAATAAPLRPAEHGSFGHYTFALTWQPGFCSTDGGCRRGQPHTVLIGLHGLWAARPRSLLDHHISAPQWWRRGCDYYHASRQAPRLPPDLLARLEQVMPHLRDSLLTHEYDKHVQCFGFDPETFFTTELRMRRRVVDSAFGRYLTGRAQGHDVRRAELIEQFARAFATDQRAALQLRCGRNRQGRIVLTQLWITLHTDALERFPRDGALMNAPIAQSNCPARLHVPRWR